MSDHLRFTILTIFHVRQFLDYLHLPYIGEPEIAVNHRGVQTLVYFAVSSQDFAEYTASTISRQQVSAFRNSATECTVAMWASDLVEWFRTNDGQIDLVDVLIVDSPGIDDQGAPDESRTSFSENIREYLAQHEFGEHVTSQFVVGDSGVPARVTLNTSTPNDTITKLASVGITIDRLTDVGKTSHIVVSAKSIFEAMAPETAEPSSYVAHWVPADDTVGSLVSTGEDYSDYDPDDYDPLVGIRSAILTLPNWFNKDIADWKPRGFYLCLRVFQRDWQTGVCMAKLDVGGSIELASRSQWSRFVVQSHRDFLKLVYRQCMEKREQTFVEAQS